MNLQLMSHMGEGRREVDVYITLAWHGREGVLDPKWTPSSSETSKRGNKKKWKFRHQKWVCLDFKWTPHLGLLLCHIGNRMNKMTQTKIQDSGKS